MCACDVTLRTARVADVPESRIVYPRIDPAVIALISCSGYVLLGRQARWAPGRYSCLAGGSYFSLTLGCIHPSDMSQHMSTHYSYPLPQSIQDVSSLHIPPASGCTWCRFSNSAAIATKGPLLSACLLCRFCGGWGNTGNGCGEGGPRGVRRHC